MNWDKTKILINNVNLLSIMEQKTSPLVYLLLLLGIIMLILFFINMFPPYPSYPLACGMGGSGYIINFYQNFLFLLGAIALILGAVFLSGKGVSRQEEKVKEPKMEQKVFKEKAAKNEVKESNNGALKLIENLLGQDELAIMGIVLENDGITQDSLRFRTGFSQSKISMIIKKLEEKNLIVREKFGKTYRIHMSEWLKGLMNGNS